MNTTNSTALILISLGIIFFFAKPMYADLSTLMAQKADYDDAITKMQSIQDLEKSLNDKISSLSPEDRLKIDTLLPDAPGNVKLVSDIDAVAARYGLAIDQIATEEVNNDSAASISTASTSSAYSTMLIDFSFKSDYSNLKKFLTDLESSLRLMDIRSIDASSPDKSGIYSYKVSIQVYWLKKNEIK